MGESPEPRRPDNSPLGFAVGDPNPVDRELGTSIWFRLEILLGEEIASSKQGAISHQEVRMKTWLFPLCYGFLAVLLLSLLAPVMVAGVQQWMQILLFVSGVGTLGALSTYSYARMRLNNCWFQPKAEVQINREMRTRG